MNKSEFHFKKKLKHSLFTVRNFNLMKNFDKERCNLNSKFISGVWEIYVREEKIINNLNIAGL